MNIKKLVLALVLFSGLSVKEAQGMNFLEKTVETIKKTHPGLFPQPTNELAAQWAINLGIPGAIQPITEEQRNELSIALEEKEKKCCELEEFYYTTENLELNNNISLKNLIDVLKKRIKNAQNNEEFIGIKVHIHEILSLCILCKEIKQKIKNSTVKNRSIFLQTFNSLTKSDNFLENKNQLEQLAEKVRKLTQKERPSSLAVPSSSSSSENPKNPSSRSAKNKKRQGEKAKNKEKPLPQIDTQNEIDPNEEVLEQSAPLEVVKSHSPDLTSLERTPFSGNHTPSLNQESSSSSSSASKKIENCYKAVENAVPGEMYFCHFSSLTKPISELRTPQLPSSSLSDNSSNKQKEVLLELRITDDLKQKEGFKAILAKFEQEYDFKKNQNYKKYIENCYKAVENAVPGEMYFCHFSSLTKPIYEILKFKEFLDNCEQLNNFTVENSRRNTLEDYLNQTSPEDINSNYFNPIKQLLLEQTAKLLSVTLPMNSNLTEEEFLKYLLQKQSNKKDTSDSNQTSPQPTPAPSNFDNEIDLDLKHTTSATVSSSQPTSLESTPSSDNTPFIDQGPSLASQENPNESIGLTPSNESSPELTPAPSDNRGTEKKELSFATVFSPDFTPLESTPCSDNHMPSINQAPSLASQENPNESIGSTPSSETSPEPITSFSPSTIGIASLLSAHGVHHTAKHTGIYERFIAAMKNIPKGKHSIETFGSMPTWFATNVTNKVLSNLPTSMNNGFNALAQQTPATYIAASLGMFGLAYGADHVQQAYCKEPTKKSAFFKAGSYALTAGSLGTLATGLFSDKDTRKIALLGTGVAALGAGVWGGCKELSKIK